MSKISDKSDSFLLDYSNLFLGPTIYPDTVYTHSWDYVYWRGS